MGSEENTSYRQTQRGTNTGNSESYDHSNTNDKGDMRMIKHPYQTCLTMPLSLKEDMTSICDEYHTKLTLCITGLNSDSPQNRPRFRQQTATAPGNVIQKMVKTN